VNNSTELADLDNNEFEAVELLNPTGTSQVLVICEHASNFFPPEYEELGLNDDVRQSHIAWDPGAFEVANLLGEKLHAQTIVGKVSRLVYDCNRPPEAIDAVPERSEVFEVPGNQGLSAAAYQDRVDRCFTPFTNLVSKTIRWSKVPRVIVTVHSFTPVYRGVPREADIGILHDADTRLADAMLQHAPELSALRIERNEPYGPADGVTFTLKKHGIANDFLNVMVEVRNDLITNDEECEKIADLLAQLVNRALETLNASSLGEAG